MDYNCRYFSLVKQEKEKGRVPNGLGENNQRLMLSVLFPEMKWSIAFPAIFSILVFTIPAAVLSLSC